MKNKSLEKEKTITLLAIMGAQSKAEFMIEKLTETVEDTERALENAEQTINELNEEIKDLNKQVVYYQSASQQER